MFAVLMSALLMGAADPPSPAAAPTPPNAVSARPVKKPDGQERVCWEEKPTGSHLAKTICATRDELERAQQEAKASLAGRMTPVRKGFGPS